MTVLAGQHIPETALTPWRERTVHAASGLTGGRSFAGYDVHLAQDIWLSPCWLPGSFRLGHTIERFDVPTDCIAYMKDKSSLARRGIQVFNSTAEPGWRGHLTVEIVNNSWRPVRLYAGQPILHVLFHLLTAPAQYIGKYQDQPARPVAAIREAQ